MPKGQANNNPALRLGVFGFLLHNFQDHLASSRTALWSRMDADCFLRCPSIFFPVHVNSEGKEKRGHD